MKMGNNVFRQLFHYLSEDEEYEELKKYIPQKELDMINKNGMQGLQLIFSTLIFFVPIGMYIEAFLANNRLWVENLMWMFSLIVMALICLYVIKNKPDYFKFLVPVNIVVYLIVATTSGLSYKHYRTSEYFLTWISLFSCQVMTAPTNWKMNWAAYTIGGVYFNYCIWITYTEIPIELYFSTFMSILFFNWFSFLANSKLKILFSMILSNGRLIKEISKIIKAFPHAVLIQSNEECYTNHEFDRNIKDISEQFDKLKKVHITIDEKQREMSRIQGEETIPSHIDNLKKLLEIQVEKLSRREIIEQDSVFICTQRLLDRVKDSEGDISCSSQSDDEMQERDELDKTIQQDNQRGRYCNIKSMKVLWKGKTSFMHVFIDTTNILKLEEATNNIKWQRIMFASASHEFRTPLNAIINSWKFVRHSFTQIKQMALGAGIKAKDESQFQRNWANVEKFLNIGLHSSELLLALVEDVLNLSKIESNLFTVLRSNFNLIEMIQEVVDLFKFQCEAKKLKFNVKIDSNLQNYKLWSDRQRIKQTFINLLANAYKFTFEGSVSLTARKILQNNKKFIEFLVADTGVGISDTDKGKLFKLFGMLDTTKTINPNGWGIGLTVSKAYVEKLGGQISVDSEVNKGTIMRFTIPDEIEGNESSKEESKHSHQPLLQTHDFSRSNKFGNNQSRTNNSSGVLMKSWSISNKVDFDVRKDYHNIKLASKRLKWG
jgi:signal transduction histidine kinase